MEFNLINKLTNNKKDNNFVQNFIKEITKKLEKNNKEKEENLKKSEILKQEGTLYQVVEMTKDGAYLENTKTGRVSEEKDIPKELYDSIGNDFVLKYENGKYILEPLITEYFMNSLVSIDEYSKIQNKFISETEITKIPADTKYRYVMKSKDYSILKYNIGDKEKTIKVPNVLIPFFATTESYLKFENNKFQIDN